MSIYIKHFMQCMMTNRKNVGYDVSQHRRYTTHYEDLCM